MMEGMFLKQMSLERLKHAQIVGFGMLDFDLATRYLIVQDARFKWIDSWLELATTSSQHMAKL